MRQVRSLSKGCLSGEIRGDPDVDADASGSSSSFQDVQESNGKAAVSASKAQMERKRDKTGRDEEIMLLCAGTDGQRWEGQRWNLVMPPVFSSLHHLAEVQAYPPALKPSRGKL